MKRLTLTLVIAALLPLSGRAFEGAPLRAQEKDPQAKAADWIAKADSTRVTVNGVLTQAVDAGAAEHAIAGDNVADARRWLAQGDTVLAEAKSAMEEEDYETAANQGNMAWQLFVKAGSAAVRAARLVGGG